MVKFLDYFALYNAQSEMMTSINMLAVTWKHDLTVIKWLFTHSINALSLIIVNKHVFKLYNS